MDNLGFADQIHAKLSYELVPHLTLITIGKFLPVKRENQSGKKGPIDSDAYGILTPKSWLNHFVIADHMKYSDPKEPSENSKILMAFASLCSNKSSDCTLDDIIYGLENLDASALVKNYIVACLCACLSFKDLYTIFDHFLYKDLKEKLPMHASDGILRDSDMASKIYLQFADKIGRPYACDILGKAVSYLTSNPETNRSEVGEMTVVTYIMAIMETEEDLPPPFRMILFHIKTCLRHRERELNPSPNNDKLKTSSSLTDKPNGYDNEEKHKKKYAGENDGYIAAQIFSLLFLRCISPVLIDPGSHVSDQHKRTLRRAAKHLQIYPTKLMAGESDTISLRDFLLGISEPAYCDRDYFHILDSTDKGVVSILENRNFEYQASVMALIPCKSFGNNVRNSVRRVMDVDNERLREQIIKDKRNESRMLVKSPKSGDLKVEMLEVASKDREIRDKERELGLAEGGGYQRGQVTNRFMLDEREDVTCATWFNYKRRRVVRFSLLGFLIASMLIFSIVFNPNIMTLIGTPTSLYIANSINSSGLGGSYGLKWSFLMFAVFLICILVTELLFRYLNRKYGNYEPAEKSVLIERNDGPNGFDRIAV